MENNQEIRLITSERGGNLIVFNNHKYRFIRRRKDNIEKWTCTNNKCTASLLVEKVEKNGENQLSVKEVLGEHFHSTIATSKIERQVLKENCKRKAVESVSTRPVKIIRTELIKGIDTSVLQHKDLKSVRKAIYCEKRKIYPALPKNLIEAVTELRNMKTNDVFKYRDQQFIYVHDEKNLICITTKDNLNFMVNCTTFLADGTFDFAPNHFLQMYTIHCYQNRYYVPLVFFFLENKSKTTYIDMWNYLKDLCLITTSKVLEIKYLHLDFEIGAHEAVRETFPGVTIFGCRFHLAQAWWRKINEDKILKNAYKDENSEFGNWLKMFFGLPFLQHTEVEDGFIQLMALCPNELYGHRFADYILKTYVEPGCLFPPVLWAKEPSQHPRTTNAAESFHRTINRQFYCTRPPIYAVIQTLLETQEETSLKLNSIQQGTVQKASKAEEEKISKTIQSYINYCQKKSSEGLIKYLTHLGNLYRGIIL
ncbi:Uncharacterized protein FWK35_00034149 [Aphis craccivora]|uniref:MULE domain-containing protein n=1 Tax=Aphis craccivora TaxID=307492 RepID=A0A6G0VPQ0_APHCR|nr:Uncharacterized protein FWK35_00034149 [Aphis craccivora]